MCPPYIYIAKQAFLKTSSGVSVCLLFPLPLSVYTCDKRVHEVWGCA